MPDQLEHMSVEQLIAEIHRLRAENAHRSDAEDTLRRQAEEIIAHQQRLDEAHALLQRLQGSYQDLYEFAPVAQLSIAPGGAIEDLNTTAARLLGLPKGQIVGRPFLDFVLDADQPKLLEHMRACETQTGPLMVELIIRAGENAWIPVQLTSESREIETSSGRRTTTRRVYRTAITRLSRLCQVEEDLRASEERLKLAQQAGGIGSWDFDLLTNEMRWSDEHYRLLGLEPGSVRPSYATWQQCLHPEDRDKMPASGLGGENVSTVALEYRIILPGDGIRWLASRGKVLRDRLGRRVRMVGTTIDITESKETHRQLQELNAALIDRTREAEQRNEQLRTLAAQLTQAENRERRRLALLLHDHLQQLLIASKMKLGVIKHTLQTGRLGALVVQISELLDEAVSASRSLSVELSPPMLYESGLAAALEWLANQAQDKHGLQVEVHATDEPEDEDIRIFLFQCVRELLLNVVKHAGVSQARVTMERYDAEHVIITVSDEGKGVDLASLKQQWALGGSFGLLSVHERLELLGGRLEIESVPNQGMRASLIAPVRKPRLGRAAATS